MSVSTADGDVRYVPGEQKQRDLTAVAHESRYIWLTDNFVVRGLSVLDFGCGSGYGAGYLASHGARVMGPFVRRMGHLVALELLAKHCAPTLINPVNLEHVLGEVQTDSRDLHSCLRSVSGQDRPL